MRTNRTLVLTLLAMGLPAAAPGATISWRNSLAGALSESARTGRPVFADFHASW